MSSITILEPRNRLEEIANDAEGYFARAKQRALQSARIARERELRARSKETATK